WGGGGSGGWAGRAGGGGGGAERRDRGRLRLGRRLGGRRPGGQADRDAAAQHEREGGEDAHQGGPTGQPDAFGSAPRPAGAASAGPPARHLGPGGGGGHGHERRQTRLSRQVIPNLSFG